KVNLGDGVLQDLFRRWRERRLSLIKGGDIKSSRSNSRQRHCYPGGGSHGHSDRRRLSSGNSQGSHGRHCRLPSYSTGEEDEDEDEEGETGTGSESGDGTGYSEGEECATR
ncbi:unnamed protein product, partial [Discosporangium mesarthrocarpum]